MNTEECIKEFTATHGDRYDYSLVEYVNRATEVKIICRVHGVFKQRSAHHKSGSGCRVCAGNAKVTLPEFVIRSKEVHGDRYDYSSIGTINGVMSNVNIICKEHGVFPQTPSAHMSGQGCPSCSNKKPLTRLQAIEKIKSGIGDNIDFSNFIYTRKKDKCKLVCKDHGEFTTSVELAELGYGCPQCGGRKGKMTTEFFIRCAKLVHGDLYDYTKSVFTDSYTPLKIGCKKHGTFEQLHHNHLKGTGCPDCKPKVSKIELSVSEALQEYLPIRISGLISGKQELDIVFPSRGVAVEINGVYYHHEGRKSVDFHLQKTLDCLDIGLQLMHFWDFEVIEKRDIVVSMIKSKLNVTDSIMARKTIVSEINTSEASKFLNATHISGNTPATKYYGLFSDSELVAVASFGKARFNDRFDWEVLRYASKINTRVIGGFSKLFAYFVKSNNPRNVITYADRRFGEGKVYDKCGFAFSHDSKPSYIWVSSRGAILKRYQAQKHKLPKLLGDSFDPTKSEADNMLANGFNRVYDCGNKVFTWTKGT